MTRIRYILLLVLISLPLMAGAQKVYTVDQVPDVQKANASHYVSDPEGQLSSSTVSSINSKLSALRSQTGVETAVVVVPSIGNDTPEDFGVRLFERWKLGQKGEDNGLLILLVTADRYIRFEVGYGLEGILTDAGSKRIQTQRMGSYLAAGDWDNALSAGVDAVYELFTDPNSELHAAQAVDDNALFIGRIVFLLIIMAAVIAIAMISSNRQRKCPRCGSKMEVVDRTTTRLSPTIKRETTTYRCPNCGYTKKTYRNIDSGPIIAGGLGGALGGLGGLGRGGGGSFGGGWGGGRSGGGGATTRF